jgi:hypothetical protein
LPFLPPPSASSPVLNHSTTSQTLTSDSYCPANEMQRSGTPSCRLSHTASPSRRLSPSPFNRSSGTTSSLCARDWVPLRDGQHFASMFIEALWGHTHSMLPPRSDTVNVDP